MSKKKKNEEIVYGKQELLKKTIPYIKKEWKTFLVAFILVFVIAFLQTYTPLLTKSILDDYILNDSYTNDLKYQAITRLLVLYGILTIVMVVARYFMQYFMSLTGMNIERRLRNDAIRKIDFLPVDYYSLEPDGKIVSKITNDSNGVRVFFETMFSIFQALINIVVVYVGIIYLMPSLGLILLVLVPVLLIWVTIYRRRVHSYYQDLRETGSRITGKLNELITGALVIQDFNQEESMLGDYKALVNRYNYNDKKANTVAAYFGWELLMLIKRIAEVAILVYFGFRYFEVGGTVITVGLVTTFTDYLTRMINPVNAIFNNLNELEDSMVGANRVYLFMDEANDTRVLDGARAPKDINGDVEFKDVWFSYVKGKPVLKGISLKVPAGKNIGIVGHTGSGKSSLMNLLLAYNDYDSGSILVDGVDIKTYNKQSYRQNLGIVLQTPALFAGTIKSNLTMERDIYTDDEIRQVLLEVGAKDLLDKNGNDINAPISFRGENLSLGEKQLISFARILLRNPKILVLDEATANIDTETENKIKHAMDVVCQNRTTFIIAHRLSTIKDCDEIIVLNDGVIVGKGDHKYLYDTCDVYKEMYDSQFKNYK